MIALALLLSSLLRGQCWVSGSILDNKDNTAPYNGAVSFCRDTVGNETLLRLEDINEKIEPADVYGFYVTTSTPDFHFVDAVIPLDMVIRGKGSSPRVYIERYDTTSDGTVIIKQNSPNMDSVRTIQATTRCALKGFPTCPLDSTYGP